MQLRVSLTIVSSTDEETLNILENTIALPESIPQRNNVFWYEMHPSLIINLGQVQYYDPDLLLPELEVLRVIHPNAAGFLFHLLTSGDWNVTDISC